MDIRPAISSRPSPRGRRRWFVCALAVVVAVIAGGTAHARFFNGVSLGGNAFTTGSLAAPTGLALTGTHPISLSWTPTASTYATGHNVYRSTSAGGPRTLVGSVTPRTTTTYGENPGLGGYYYEVEGVYENWASGPSNQVARTTSTFVFKSTAGYTASGGCYAATVRQRDMEQGFVPTDPAETMVRSGGTGSLTFCSDTFTAGETLAAGTTSITAWVAHTHAQACTLTGYLVRNDTELLGSGTINIPNSALAARTWSFATTGFTAAAGDRLNLLIVWGSSNFCNSTTMHYDGAATPSYVTVPTITGV